MTTRDALSKDAGGVGVWIGAGACFPDSVLESLAVAVSFVTQVPQLLWSFDPVGLEVGIHLHVGAEEADASPFAWLQDQLRRLSTLADCGVALSDGELSLEFGLTLGALVAVERH